MQGALATAVGLGAALSNSFGGELIQHYSYRISFLALGAVAALALALLWAGVPETLPQGVEPGAGALAPPQTQEAAT
jgi:predicted MFS family arabinose efflux permease